MKGFDKGWFVAAVVAVSLLVLGSTGPALAAYVDEVQADDPAFWWRLDEAPGDDFAVSIGSSFTVGDGQYTDVEQGVTGLIVTDPGNAAAQFDGFVSQLAIPDEDGLNTGGPWQEKSVVLWFQADDPDTEDPQVIFEQGGTTRGLNVYVHEGNVVVGAWNRGAGDGGGAASPWPTDNAGMEIISVSAPVNAGETYQVAMVMEGVTDGFDGTLTGYLNGQSIGEETGVGDLFAHSDNVGIGYRSSESAFPGENASGGGSYFAGVVDEVALYNTALSADRVLAQYTAGGGAGGVTPLKAGDANMDYEFNQLDLVQVQIAAKYLTGQAATWGEGDWDAAPGGEPGNPPQGNGTFDQLDIIAALGAGTYLTGPYNAIAKGGVAGDGQTSIGYDVGTGEVWVDAPAGVELTSVNIDSAGSIFTGEAAQNLGGSFDNDADNNIFKATFGSSFGSLSFGNVAQPGLSEDFVANDLTAVGSLAGGGDLGAVDLIYVPEPSALVLFGLGVVGMLLTRSRRRA